MAEAQLDDQAAAVATRVVVADDDVLLREGLASLLERSRFEVVGQAADGRALVALVREHTPDLVIVDVRMPPTHTTEGLEAAKAGRVPLPPEAELQWWYQYYFATERGRAGYDTYRREFNKLIWRIASPKWDFDDATFERTAASFDNPDHVEIVIHNYRWRLGLAEGEPECAELEERLAEGPVISVPAITLEGDANGAPHPEPDAYAAKCSGAYSHRTVEGGVGHNLPQEAPAAFADAILELGGRGK